MSSNKKKNNKIFAIILISILFVIIICVAVNKLSGKITNEQPQLQNNVHVPNSEEEIVQICSEQHILNVDFLTNCLVKQIRTFYNFTLTMDTYPLTLDDLKTRGGDCYDWSRLFQRLATKIGLKTKIVTIPYTTSSPQPNHDLVIIYQTDLGFCLINSDSDGITYLCPGGKNE